MFLINTFIFRFIKNQKKTIKENIYVLSDNYESGGAGLIGTVEDYMKFADVLCSGGKTKDGYELISEKYIDILTENQMTTKILLEDFKKMKQGGYGYALGVRVMIEEGNFSPVGEFGWDSAAGAWVMIDRKNGITAFYAQHVLDCEIAYDEIHPNIKKLIYQCLDEN